ncbi:hypothetical protein [Aliiruegeria sabulilitoris]|uniref:hypothetical protein n=1 Tax=Aliiruegeria sabulilitoris TaxID=1510458 RepID=UPI000836C36A|nr:hypothetical protein [Aliiruegeria sabulilitoris]NDR55270.1 hypothetical protein [Pseudoruegeria sp. M32A2M]
MFQYMMPVDYMRTSMAMWSRTAELQLEVVRMSMGLADSWTGGLMKPDPAVMKYFTPTGMSSKKQKEAKPVAEKATPSPEAKTAPEAKAAAPELVEASAKVVPLETPKAEVAPAVSEPVVAKPVATKPAEAKPATARRRAPSKPKTPEGVTVAVAPVETAKPAAKPRRRAAPKAKPVAAATPVAETAAAKPAPRRRAPAKKASSTPAAPKTDGA